jgi:dipeptidyl aminopeptidase/acylaminoacyl peptidase
MRRTLLATGLALTAWMSASAQAPLPDAASAKSGTGTGYLTPPKVIVDILDAAPPPTGLLSPSRDVLVVYERRSMPSIAELAQPMLRLAGLRLNPRTNAPHRGADIVGVTLTATADGASRKVTLPAERKILPIGFSPDGSRLAVGVLEEQATTLWLIDVATAQAHAVTGAARLNWGFGEACEWQHDSRALLCRLVPANRGAEPVAPAAPSGPNVQETQGKAAPVRTYQDLLTSAQDEALFEHYFTSQLAHVDVASGQATPIGEPALYVSADPSPDGTFLLVSTLTRPFSRLVPYDDFPKRIAVWTREGRLARAIADVPMADTVPITGVITGPRSVQWDPTRPARVVWAEALDGGDLKNRVQQRDKLMTIEAPFAAAPRELLRTEFRFTGIKWTDARVALVSEFDRPKRRARTWIVDSDGATPRQLWDRSIEDRYGDPGAPLPRTGGHTIRQAGSSIFLEGDGASPKGDHPFLDRLDLATLKTTRLYQATDDSYEAIVDVLADDGGRVLTRRETRTDPPNFIVRTREGERFAMRALTTVKNPAPQLAGVQKRLVTYKRADGIALSGTLYLPPGYVAGTKLPVLMWAYPREFTSASAASQVTGSPHRFLTIAGPSHLLLLTQGYAIFDNPAMPVVGEGETANDTYVEQLVSSAQAAVDVLVAEGVGDRDRMGVGGHSYGAFMTANLLAHSDLFRAGIARSGAYNRTLTPFGFQAETRSFWEVPQIYSRMSPFWYANRINEPILLTHGEMDNNSGTFPIQSERLYMALKGFGATVRYVTLPYESHGYTARESVLHTVAEMLNWADKYVKNAPVRAPSSSSP